ncbi:hypothetical protein AMATHDRAFT_85277 [Amanita thiersii Skay4041]|uniref:Peptidase M43 pregnancy-associated plasma-A domain-containing protein n=1 Tax=Amanita thiersii Skay4041 TaxID=703135 RepID=A0A2A9NL30_9AGAR|nr:hypothetical protein AMATHDRAFT_85277 [Amanita thiersii Skay4041]
MHGEQIPLLSFLVPLNAIALAIFPIRWLSRGVFQSRLSGWGSATKVSISIWHRCGISVSPEHAVEMEEGFQMLKKERSSLTNASVLTQTQTKPIVIDVYWHIVAADIKQSKGWVPEGQLTLQMQELNRGYSQVGVSFRHIHTEYIINTVAFHKMWNDSDIEYNLKAWRRKGGPAALNVYTMLFESSKWLGFATFPQQYTKNPVLDGVILDFRTLPGGKLKRYNLGRTLTHEVGHWLGLFHTFQGGCSEPGDYVSDTPPQRSATYGCPVYSDTCDGGGPDMIHNFMDYSDDICLTMFTPGQGERMFQLMSLYRM